MDDTTVDLSRATMRLEGLSLYGVVAALLLNFTFNMLSSTPIKLDDNRSENLVKIAFLLSSGVTILFGTHTAIVFMLLEVYTKTALGMGKDSQFLIYMDATLDHRKLAFQALVVSLFTYMVAFLLSMYLSLDNKLRGWFTMLSAAVVAISVHHMVQIVLLSSEILFG